MMLFISNSIPYKNLILHTLLSISITLLLSLVNLPTRFLQALHTYILPENVGGNGNGTTNQSNVRAAIRRPSDQSDQKRKNRSKDKFEFDENNAQIFRLQLTDDHIRSRLYFKQYRDIFLYTVVSCSNLGLYNLLSTPEGGSKGILVTGSVVPTVFGIVAVLKAVVVIATVSFEKSASKRSEKQMSVVLGILGFVLAVLIVLVRFYSIFDFRFDSVDGLGKVSIALFAGCLAGFLYVPATKSARSFWLGTDQLRWNLSIISCGWITRTLLYVNYIVIVFTSLLWINPVAGFFINKINVSQCKANAVQCIGDSNELIGNIGIAESDFMKLRFWCLLASGLVQIVTLRPNLQMFLNEAVLSWYQRLHSSKLPDLDFSRAKIFLHNYYLCLVVLQFIVPPALVLVFLGLSRIEGNFVYTFPFVCGIVPCSAFVKEVALFMSWWVVFVWSIFTSLILVMYRSGLLYVS